MKNRGMFATLVAAAMVLTFGASGAAASEKDVPSDSALSALDSLGLLTESSSNSQLNMTASGLSVGLVSPSAGLTLESGNGNSVAIRPVTDARGTVAADGRAVVYAAGADYDYVVTGNGAAANAGYAIIGNADAPAAYQFEVSVNGEPAQLVLTDRGVTVQDQNGVPVNLIGAAWAKDANGVSVPTFYTVEGNVLIQHVDHNGYAYPVVADPSLHCDWVFCTVMYNRSETQTIAAWGGTASVLITAGCTALAGPIGGLSCGFAAAYASSMAQQALNEGKCVGIRAFIYVPQTTAHAVIEPCV